MIFLDTYNLIAFSSMLHQTYTGLDFSLMLHDVITFVSAGWVATRHLRVTTMWRRSSLSTTATLTSTTTSGRTSLKTARTSSGSCSSRRRGVYLSSHLLDAFTNFFSQNKVLSYCCIPSIFIPLLQTNPFSVSVYLDQMVLNVLRYLLKGMFCDISVREWPLKKPWTTHGWT